MAVQVVAPDIGIVVVLALESAALQVLDHEPNVPPVPAVAFMPTLVTAVGTVVLQVLVLPAAALHVKLLLAPGENWLPPPKLATTVPLPSDALALTIIVNLLPVPPPVPPPVEQAELVGSLRHRLTPLRFTVAVGDPVAVVNVQVPEPAVP